MPKFTVTAVFAVEADTLEAAEAEVVDGLTCATAGRVLRGVEAAEFDPQFGFTVAHPPFHPTRANATVEECRSLQAERSRAIEAARDRGAALIARLQKACAQ